MSSVSSASSIQLPLEEGRRTISTDQMLGRQKMCEKISNEFLKIQEQLNKEPAGSYYLYTLPKGQEMEEHLTCITLLCTEIVFLKSKCSGKIISSKLVPRGPNKKSLFLDEERYFGTVKEIIAALEVRKNAPSSKDPKYGLKKLTIPSLY